VRDDGIVVTSAALLTRGDVWARLPDGTAVRGDLVGSDPMTGLGLVDLRGDGFTTSVLAQEGDLMAGEVSYGVTARPGGGTITAPSTVGRAVRYVGPTGGALDGIAVSGKPSGLALGGALADPRGAVVGITTAVDEDETGGWFVMPVEAVDKVVDDLLSDGTVHGCWLGIEGADTPDPAAAGSRAGGGTSVTSVIDDSPAALGGLEVGDVVVGLDDRPVTHMPDLNVALRSHSPGDRVDVDVARADGSKVTLVITLGEAPTSPAVPGR
jgi:serine protease Do